MISTQSRWAISHLVSWRKCPEISFWECHFCCDAHNTLIFDDQTLFNEFLGRAHQEVLQCDLNEGAISVEGVVHSGKLGRICSRMSPIASKVGWEKYVNIVMKNDCQCLDVFVQYLSSDHIPCDHSPDIAHSPFMGYHQNRVIQLLMTLSFVDR